MQYVDQIDAAYPADFWPGRALWTDADGSRGTYATPPGQDHPAIYRLRVPAGKLAEWWGSRIDRFDAPPQVTVGPLETPGLAHWLVGEGYVLHRRDHLMALALAGRSRSFAPVRRWSRWPTLVPFTRC